MSDAPEETERRSAERATVRGALAIYSKRGGVLSGLFGGRSKKRPVPVRNLSSNGICFLCNERLRAGTSLAITVRVSERGPDVLVMGKVVNTGQGRGAYPYQAHVQLVDFKGDAWQVLSHLEDFVVPREEATTSLLKRQARPQEDSGNGQGHDDKTDR